MEKFLLIVEGNDDEHVTRHVLETNKILFHSIEFKKGGTPGLLDVLAVQLKGTGSEVIGVILDADTHPSGRWESILNILKKAGYDSAPQQPDPAGTVIDQIGRPRVGVWIMPDNSKPGMLEDFVVRFVPEDDVLWDDAVQIVGSIISRGVQRFPIGHQTKAQIHTWLAWQEEPGTPLGLAIKKKYLDPHCTEGSAFFDWLKRLYNF